MISRDNERSDARPLENTELIYKGTIRGEKVKKKNSFTLVECKRPDNAGMPNLMHSPRSKKNTFVKSAFTLIELLVVLSMIVILSSLLLPALKKVGVLSEAITCKENLKQLGLAGGMYVVDYNGIFPRAFDNNDPKSTWSWDIWTYAGYEESQYSVPYNDFYANAGNDSNIYTCPTILGNSTAIPGLNVQSNKVSYGLNNSPAGNWARKTPINTREIEMPAQCAWLLDNSFFMGGRQFFFNYFGMMPHSESPNVLFHDGHVVPVPYIDISKNERDPFWGKK